MQVAVAGVSSTARKAAGEKGDTGQSPSSIYAPFYLSCGHLNHELDIQDLERMALDRLKVLKAVEKARERNFGLAGVKGPPSAKAMEGFRSDIKKAEREHNLNITPVGNEDHKTRVLVDEASHFLLRLAFCKTHEHRSWFLIQEHDLFTTRLEGAGAEFALGAIQKADGPVIMPVSSSDMDKSLFNDLDAVSRGPNYMAAGASGIRYYKIAFEHVPALVRHRKVLLRAGAAYVGERHILDVAAAQFRAKLNQSIVTASRAISFADDDIRMGPILKSIRAHFAAEAASRNDFDPSRGVDSISLNELNSSLPAMPLCMSNMMTRLREQHHLRHSARMQLGVFLKGCGLTMDESLRFWRSEFAKGNINSEKFEKTYSYNIRHHYGKEGKRRNLTPFSCIRVINDRPGPGEHNGCPYREFEERRLMAAVKSMGVPDSDVPAIAAKAREGNFQAACGMCFASTQPGHHARGDQGYPAFLPQHPNEYFIEARRRQCAPASAEQQTLTGDGDEDMPLPATGSVTQPGSVTPVLERTMPQVEPVKTDSLIMASALVRDTNADTSVTEDKAREKVEGGVLDKAASSEPIVNELKIEEAAVVTERENATDAAGCEEDTERKRRKTSA